VRGRGHGVRARGEAGEAGAPRRRGPGETGAALLATECGRRKPKPEQGWDTVRRHTARVGCAAKIAITSTYEFILQSSLIGYFS